MGGGIMKDQRVKKSRELGQGHRCTRTIFPITSPSVIGRTTIEGST